MSDNEVIHTSETGAKKAGNDERHDLIPARPLRKLARHYGIGARKYDVDNWAKGYDWRLSFAAMMRHAWQFWGGEDIDPETGSPHTVAIAWHAFTLTEFMETHREFDTRTTTVEERTTKSEEVKLPSLVGIKLFAYAQLRDLTTLLGDSVVVIDKYGKAFQGEYPILPGFYPMTVVYVDPKVVANL